MGQVEGGLEVVKWVSGEAEMEEQKTSSAHTERDLLSQLVSLLFLSLLSVSPLPPPDDL